jgi:hypothetical protein
MEGPSIILDSDEECGMCSTQDSFFLIIILVKPRRGFIVKPWGYTIKPRGFTVKPKGLLSTQGVLLSKCAEVLIAVRIAEEMLTS